MAECMVKAYNLELVATYTLGRNVVVMWYMDTTLFSIRESLRYFPICNVVSTLFSFVFLGIHCE